MSRNRPEFARAVFTPRYHVENLPTGSTIMPSQTQAIPSDEETLLMPKPRVSRLWVVGSGLIFLAVIVASVARTLGRCGRV